ncbi:MAG: helix-turn-helix transcriptional regulator [Opitutaceae bacterium]
MDEVEITKFLLSVSGKLERRNEKLSESVDALLGVLDALGLAWAVKDLDDASHFRLNDAARQDLGHLPAQVPYLAVPSDRERLLSEPAFFLWKPKPDSEAVELSALSQRELEVYEWMRKGKTIEATAIILGISPRTVEKHRQHIKEKLS